MAEKSYKIRKLTRKDRKIFAGLIKKLADTSQQNSLFNIIKSGITEETKSGKPDEGAIKASYLELGMSLLNNMLDLIEKDIAEWFADLIGVSMDKYDECPFGIEVFIAEQILASDEVADFFTSASRAYSSIQLFRSQQTSAKTK